MELPPAKKTGSKEVSGEADGVTLAECLADGRVPVPDRMSFPKWQQWRKAEGRRPIKRKDGAGLSTAEEVALWRATMEALYGEKEADEADESEDDDSSELRPGAAPPAALVPVHGAARSVGSSPRPSSGGTGPVEIEQLQKELYGMHDPVMEDLSEYLERVTRLVLALKTLGHNVSAVDLERITMKAEMLKEAFDLVGPEPKLLVRALRERFTRLALDEVLGEQEKSVQVGCIGELILGLGGKESAASDKLFSTPSIEDGAVGLPTRSATKSGGLGEPRVGLAADRGDGGESPLRAKVAALEMELEALKRRRFMYLFMGVLWGHFSSSNSPGILAQELDIHICANEISFQGVTWLSLTCQTVIGHITWLCVSDSFPKHFQSYRQTWLLKFFLYDLRLKQHCNLPGAHGSTSSSRSVATFAFFRVDQISVSHRQRIEP